MKKAQEREAALMAELRRQGRISVAQAAELLDISQATVRRLFIQLEAERKAIRSYGALQLAVTPDNYSFEKYEKLLTEEKRRIGVMAARLVKSGESIYMDSGTTLMRMAEALAGRLKSGEIRALNVVTNSIMNLPILAEAPNCRLIMLGGEYNRERRDFSGSVAEQTLERLHFKKCFMGSEGMTIKQGFSLDHPELCNVNMRVMERSDKRYVLMDKSKFGAEALVSYAQASDVDAILTDAEPDQTLRKQLEQLGVKLMLA